MVKKVAEVGPVLIEKHLDVMVHEEKDEALINSLSDGIIVRDKQLQVIKINPALTQMLGYTEEDLLGKRLRDVISISHAGARSLLSRELAPLHKLNRSEFVNDGTFSWSKKDGTNVIVSVATSPYRIDGRLSGTVSVIRDVSEEAAIDKAKTEFVSLAAHQLRTPLSSINWYIEMLSEDAQGQLSPSQKDHLNEIMVANQRMVDLVNDLLNVSRIDLGTFAVQPVPTNLEEIISNSVSELSKEIAQKSLHLTTAFSGPIDNYRIDPQLARIIFQNLIGNAVKYTPDRGNIDIYAILDDHKLLISIGDTGYGIPKNQQDKVFTKLFRADNVVKRDTEGTGLGLYLVKAIVERSGGTIDFVSRVNQGTTFTVTFPASGMKRHASDLALAASKKQNS